MVLYKVLSVFLFLSVCVQLHGLAFVLDQLAIPSNSSLGTNSPDLKNNTIEKMVTVTDSIKLKRQPRNADNIKKSFNLFSKRVWRGLRRYLQDKTLTYRQFESEQLKKLLKLSMYGKKIEASKEFLPFLKIVDLPLSTTMSSPSEKKQNLIQELNQTQPTFNKSPQDTNIYRLLRDKWKYQLIGEYYDNTQPAVVNYVEKLSGRAENLHQTLNKKPRRTFLWRMKQGDTLSADYTTQFFNLYILTLAYGTNGTAHYGNNNILSSVIEGLDFMVTKKGYDGETYHGYWWHWAIGVPNSFTKIMMIISEELTQHQKDLYIRIMSNYMSNPLTTKQFNPNDNAGVYSSNLAEIVLALGILRENEDTIKLSTDTVIDVLKPVREGSGFYADGSFIQHKNIPYTGLFGKELVKNVAQILSIIKDTKYELSSNVLQSILDIIDRAFLPVIYEGEMMAMVRGRAISRAQSSAKVGYGSTLVYDLLTIAKCASQHHRKKLQETVKYWLRKNPNYYLTNTRKYNDILVMTELLHDDLIIGDEIPFLGVKLYASMDRFVQRTPDYMLGLSLHSNRISAFDAGSNENKRGWHTADGMVYLYNDDEVQFNSAYWPTVDPYRLPGTTVDTIHLVDEMLNLRTTSNQKWVGGVTNNNQAVVAMSLNKKGTKNCGMVLAMDLQAKKSWFVVDGQIVALGAGITGNTKASIETVIDNRLLNDKFDYLLLSNEGIIANPAVAAVGLLAIKRKKRLNAVWILLQESTNKASIGYYFPTKETVYIINERRSGTYLDINDAFASTHKFAGNYSKLLIYHGKNPLNSSYAYVILPGITKHGIKKYVESNPVTILANSDDIQAVTIKDDKYLGVNIWKESGGEVTGVSSNKPVSILKQSHGNQDTYVVSDPTQSNSTIQIKIPEFTEVVRMSEGVEYDGEYNVFIINFVNSHGVSQQFTVLHVVYKQIHS